MYIIGAYENLDTLEYGDNMCCNNVSILKTVYCDIVVYANICGCGLLCVPFKPLLFVYTVLIIKKYSNYYYRGLKKSENIPIQKAGNREFRVFLKNYSN